MAIQNRYNEKLVKGKPGSSEILFLVGAIFVILSGVAIMLFNIMGFLFIFFGIYMLVMAIKNMKVEFEYTLTDGEIDIAKINDKSRRKEIKNIRKDDVTLIKKADSDKVKNDLSLKKEKIVYFVKEVTDTCYAIYTSINDKKEIIVLDLDEGCVEHLKAMYKRAFEE